MAAKACGGRHGGPYGRDKRNWRFVRGPRKAGRYPDAHAVCVSCGKREPGMAGIHFPDQLDAATQTTRSVQTRSYTVGRSAKPVTAAARARAEKQTKTAKAKRVVVRQDPTKRGRHRA